MDLNMLFDHMKVNDLSMEIVPVKRNGKVQHLKAVLRKEGVLKDKELIVDGAEMYLVDALFSEQLLGKPRLGSLGKALKEAEEK